MSETPMIKLERTSVLDAVADGVQASEFGLVQALPAARFSLRLSPDDAAEVSTAAGFGLAQPMNGVVGEEKLSLRLGPDEWLLIAENQNAERLADELATALNGKRFSVVDISQRNVALQLSGTRATDVLNTGCPLDFLPTSFPSGMATRTVFAKCDVIVAKTDEVPVFRLECWRSFGRYLEGYLRNSARLLGIGNIG